MLQKLMHHKNTTTTLLYYVKQDADEMAEDLWKDHLPATENNNSNL